MEKTYYQLIKYDIIIVIQGL